MVDINIPVIFKSYVPLHRSTPLISIENESCFFAIIGKIILIGDFNSRTANKLDFIVNDTSQINNFDGQDLLTKNFKPDTKLDRINQDHIINIKGIIF